MTRPKLLIVDDGDRYAELAHHFLRDYRYATRCELPGPCWSCPRRHGCTLTHAHDLAEAREALRRHPDVDVVLLDVAFELPEVRLVPSRDPDLERRRRTQGLAILGELRRTHADLPVVLMTSREELLADAAAEELTHGLDDELVTLAGADAFDARALQLLVERILAYRAQPPPADYHFGRSTAMARLRRDALTLARTSLPILLLGETGTGKSALAERVVHPATGRKGAFVAVDLAALPPALVAAELFGSARGAFSGAVDRPGRLEAAHGGTLFLDEIGNLPPDVQRMLLLSLEEGRVTRLGESTPRAVDVKLVAATNADLAALVQAGSFRADLYARLNPAARLELVPLRARLLDLEELLAGFVERAFESGADRRLLVEYAAAAGLSGEPRAELAFGRPPERPEAITFVIASASLKALRGHGWPGNVRELEQLAANAAVFALADALEAARRGIRAGARLIPIPPKVVLKLLAPSGPTPAGGLVSLRLQRQPTLHQAARSLERQLYQQLFRETDGDFAAMAQRLLGSATAAAARKVRLRFNQLGLRARSKT